MNLCPWLVGLFQEGELFSSAFSLTASVDSVVVGGCGSTPSVHAGGSLAGKDSAIASSTRRSSSRGSSPPIIAPPTRELRKSIHLKPKSDDILLEASDALFLTIIR